MKTFSLQSGSNGNAIYVEAGEVRLLFDAGISGVKAQERMAQHDRDIRDIHAVIISHDHGDHIACAGIYQRKFGLPVYMTQKTHAAAERWHHLGKMHDVRYFKSGESITFGKVTVHTLATPHDAVDGVCCVVEHEGKKLGILTDLGNPFYGLEQTLASLDAVYLESNYDRQRLAESQYPARLKRRIRGPGGHLSNEEAAELLTITGRNRPKWVAVAHLSEENNRPELAIEAQHQALGKTYPVYHASRYGCSEMILV